MVAGVVQRLVYKFSKLGTGVRFPPPAPTKNMTLITRITQLSEKGVRPLNEDTVLINKSSGIFGIFDGASSLDSFLSADKKTGAYIASHIAHDVFLKSKQSLINTLQATDIAIEEAHRINHIDITNSANRFNTTAAVVKIRDDVAELLQVGDSIILVVTKDGQVTVPLDYDDRDLALMRKWRKLADQGRTNIRQLIANDVIELRKLGNKTYGTLNGDGKATSFSQSMTVELKNIATILILSDGMFIPKADPGADEDWKLCAKLYREGGLRKLYETVRNIEKSDPDLIQYPRFKLHDDASGVAIEFT